MRYGAPVDVPLPTRLFSLREANALVTTLNEEFTKARQLRDELMGVQEKLQAEGRGIDGPGVQIDPEAPTTIQRLQGEAASVCAEGCCPPMLPSRPS